MAHSLLSKVNSEPWNKGRIIGQKLPLKLKEIWAIRIRLNSPVKFVISHYLIWQ